MSQVTITKDGESLVVLGREAESKEWQAAKAAEAKAKKTLERLGEFLRREAQTNLGKALGNGLAVAAAGVKRAMFPGGDRSVMVSFFDLDNPGNLKPLGVGEAEAAKAVGLREVLVQRVEGGGPARLSVEGPAAEEIFALIQSGKLKVPDGAAAFYPRTSGEVRYYLKPDSRDTLLREAAGGNGTSETAWLLLDRGVKAPMIREGK